MRGEGPQPGIVQQRRERPPGGRVLGEAVQQHHRLAAAGAADERLVPQPGVAELLDPVTVAVHDPIMAGGSPALR